MLAAHIHRLGPGLLLAQHADDLLLREPRSPHPSASTSGGLYFTVEEIQRRRSALLTLSEDWHNNHHAYQASVRQGFRWWEYDLTFYILRALSWFGVVWDLRVPPKAVVRGGHKLERRVIDKVARQLACSFPVDLIADRAREALASASDWTEVKSRVLAASIQPQAFLAEVDLLYFPTLDEVRHYAHARLAQTQLPHFDFGRLF